MEHRVSSSEAPPAQVASSQSNGSTNIDSAAAPDKQVNPFAPDDGRLVSLEEYWAKWYENPYPDFDVSYEWNNGRLEAKPWANKPQLDLGYWFLELLRRYLETRKIADLINMDTGFLLTMVDLEERSGTRQAVRKPDIGVILNDNPVSWGRVEQRSFRGICDAVVEFLSDSTQVEVRRDTVEKKVDYALAGVKEYYILDPSETHMHFYRLTPEARYEEIQPDSENVIHSEVLPGFHFRLDDLRQQPKLAELALDDLYSGFVLPVFKAAVIRAENAKKRADAHEQRAAAHEQRAAAHEQRAAAEEQRAAAEEQRAAAEEKRAEAEAQRADVEAQRANVEAQRAEAKAQRADVEAQRADVEAQRAEAHWQAVERNQALEAELARLRRHRS